MSIRSSRDNRASDPRQSSIRWTPPRGDSTKLTNCWDTPNVLAISRWSIPEAELRMISRRRSRFLRYLCACAASLFGRRLCSVTPQPPLSRSLILAEVLHRPVEPSVGLTPRVGSLAPREPAAAVPGDHRPSDGRRDDRSPSADVKRLGGTGHRITDASQARRRTISGPITPTWSNSAA
jgi:hypothetical protein